MIKRVICSLLLVIGLSVSTSAEERLSNGRISVAIDAEGYLTELRNAVTGTDYAGGTALWRLYYDTPDRREIQIDGASQKPQISREGDSIVLRYDNLEGLKFSLTLSVSLEEDMVRFSSELENHEEHTIVRELQYPLVGKLMIPAGFKLLTTIGGGQLTDNVTSSIEAEGRKRPYMNPDQHFRQMTLEYPKGAVAANCYALVGDSEGLYFGSHDPEFVNTGHGLRAYPSAPGVFDQLECGFYKYPNCMCDGKWSCSANVIAPYSGSWTQTSKLYRRWVDECWWDRQTPPQWVQEMKSWQRIIFKHQYGDYCFRYQDLPGRILDVEKSVDSDAVIVFGWWEKGMDNSNPDYVADSSQGGMTALSKAIADYQAGGGRAALYVNGKLIDRESDFYRSGAAAGMTFIDNTGSECLENYKFAAHGSFLGRYNYRSFAIADTRNPEWCKLMLSWAKMAHDAGASSIFYDQMGSVEASAVNWDCSGEFPVPDMAPLTAKAGALKACRDYTHSLSPDMALGAEHITDYLSMYVDYTHGDGLLSFIDWFRYTFPELILSDRCIRDDNDIERRVNLTVLKGLRNDIEIYRCRGLIDETPHYQAYLARVNELKERYKDILLGGRFAYKDYFSCSNPNVEARCFVRDGRLAIVMTSEQGAHQSVRLSVPGFKFVEASVLGKASVSRNGKTASLGKHSLAVLIFQEA